jgi:hypothetical protein
LITIVYQGIRRWAPENQDIRESRRQEISKSDVLISLPTAGRHFLIAGYPDILVSDFEIRNSDLGMEGGKDGP